MAPFLLYIGQTTVRGSFMKKIIKCLVLGIVILGLGHCSGGGSHSSPPPAPPPAPVAPPNNPSLSPAGDEDGDGVTNDVDNCDYVVNPAQADADANGIGDACDPNNPAVQLDTDQDGVSDAADNCPQLANADQVDADTDLVGDACDGLVDAFVCGDEDGNALVQTFPLAQNVNVEFSKMIQSGADLVSVWKEGKTLKSLKFHDGCWAKDPVNLGDDFEASASSNREILLSPGRALIISLRANEDTPENDYRFVSRYFDGKNWASESIPALDLPVDMHIENVFVASNEDTDNALLVVMYKYDRDRFRIQSSRFQSATQTWSNQAETVFEVTTDNIDYPNLFAATSPKGHLVLTYSDDPTFIVKKMRVYDGVSQSWEDPVDISRSVFSDTLSLGIDNHKQVVFLTLTSPPKLAYSLSANPRQINGFIGGLNCNQECLNLPFLQTNGDGMTVGVYRDPTDLFVFQYDGVHWNTVRERKIITVQQPKYLGPIFIHTSGAFVVSWYEDTGVLNPPSAHYWRAAYDSILAAVPTAKDKLLSNYSGLVDRDVLPSPEGPVTFAYTDIANPQTYHLINLESGQEQFQSSFNGPFVDVRAYHEADTFRFFEMKGQNTLRFEAVPR